MRQAPNLNVSSRSHAARLPAKSSIFWLVQGNRISPSVEALTPDWRSSSIGMNHSLSSNQAGR
jgi:hypothetical protein